MYRAMQRSILIDGRIFSLQQKGGISQLWAKLLSSTAFTAGITIHLLVYEGFERNIHFQEARPLLPTNVILIPVARPPSDNLRYRNQTDMLYIQQYIRQRISDYDIDCVINTYYGENVLPESRYYLVVVHDFAHEENEVLRAKTTTPDIIERKILALSLSTHIIFISQYSAMTCARLYPQLKQVRAVIYHGHDQISPPERVEQRKVAYVGGRGGYKDFKTLSGVWPIIVNEFPEARLVVLGGEEVGESDRLLQEALDKHVCFLNHIDDKELIRELVSSEVYVSTSFYEGFGIPILSALHARMKLVVTNISVYHEIIGERGFYFEAGDGVELCHALRLAFNSDRKPGPIVNRPWGMVAKEYRLFLEQQVFA